MILFLCASIAIAVRVAYSLFEIDGPAVADFQVYRGAVDSLLNGRGLYSYAAANGDPFTYPPFAALIFVPFTLIPSFPASTFTFVMIELAAFVWLLLTARKHWPQTAFTIGPSLLLAALAVAFAVSAPIQSNFQFGQISLILVAATFWTVTTHRSTLGAGVLLGAVAAIKLLPLAFIPYLWLTNRRRQALIALGSFMACSAVTFILMPKDSWLYWTRLLFEGRYGGVGAIRNQSIYGFLSRQFTDAPIPLIWFATAAVIGPAVLYLAVRLYNLGENTVGVVIIGCLTLLLSPASWAHHQIWAVLAILIPVGRNAWQQLAWQAAVILVMSLNTFRFSASSRPDLVLLANYRIVLFLFVCIGVPLVLLRIRKKAGT